MSLSEYNLKNGELKATLNGNSYVILNESHISDGLLWNGTTLTGPAYINCFMYGSSYTTAVASSGTWYKLNVETTEGFSRDGFVHTNNRIENTDGYRVCKCEAIISISSGNNNEIHIAFYKNGTDIVPCSEQELVTNSGGRLSGAAIQCLVPLDEDDFVEVWVKNQSNSNDIDCENYNLIVSEM